MVIDSFTESYRLYIVFVDPFRSTFTFEGFSTPIKPSLCHTKQIFRLCH